MRHDLTPDIVEALERRHREDLTRIEAIHEARRDRHARMRFERQPSARERFGALCIYALVLVTLGAYLLGR